MEHTGKTCSNQCAKPCDHLDCKNCVDLKTYRAMGVLSHRDYAELILLVEGRIDIVKQEIRITENYSSTRDRELRGLAERLHWHELRYCEDHGI